jgi:hypothetical protein
MPDEVHARTIAFLAQDGELARLKSPSLSDTRAAASDNWVAES